MKFNKGGQAGYENPKPGNYIGTCFKIINMGTQASEWQGQKKFLPKVRIFWELSEKMKDGKPFTVFQSYTNSLAQKARLRRDLESWRGKVLSDEEINSFDVKNILGKSCLISLVQNGDYTNISAITPLVSGMSAPAQVNANVVLSLEKGEFSQEVFDSLGDTTKAKIMLSPEYRELKGLAKDAPHEDDEPPTETEEVPF